MAGVYLIRSPRDLTQLIVVGRYRVRALFPHTAKLTQKISRDMLAFTCTVLNT